MKLIDSFLIVPRLKVTIENLFQTANQAIYLESTLRFSRSPARCMVNRLYASIDELGQIIKELEPRKIDTGCLTLEEALTLEGYAEIRRGLVQSWEFIECREQAIFNQAANRQAGQGIADQAGIND